METWHVWKFSNQIPKTWIQKRGKQIWFSCSMVAVNSHFPMLNHFSPSPVMLGWGWLKHFRTTDTQSLCTTTGHEYPVTRGSKGMHRNASGFLRELSAPLLSPLLLYFSQLQLSHSRARRLIEAVKALLGFSRKHMQEIPGKPRAPKQWQRIGGSLSKPPHQKKAPPRPSPCCAPAVSAPVLAGEAEVKHPRGQH